jgi:hypothetical protein
VNLHSQLERETLLLFGKVKLQEIEEDVDLELT